MPPDWEMGISGQHWAIIQKRMQQYDQLPPAHKRLVQQHDPYYVNRALARVRSCEEAAGALEEQRRQRQAARWERYGGTLPEERR